MFRPAKLARIESCRRRIRIGPLSLAISLLGIAGHAAAESVSGAPDPAFCRIRPGSACECSFGSIETTLTFSEAAEVVLIYYKDFPDERYARLLETFLSQCGGRSLGPAAPAPTATITELSGPTSARPTPLRRTREARR